MKGHHFFFNDITVILSTYFTDWNAYLEFYLALPVATANFVMLALLIRRNYPHLLLTLLIPLALLTFSPHYDLIWLYNGTFIQSTMFFLIAFWILLLYPMNWQTIGLAAFFSLCATFAYGNGIAAWPALFVVMWLLGRRRWRYYLFWIAAACVTLAFYITTSTARAPAVGAHLNALQIGAFNKVIEFTILYIGNVFAFETMSLAYILGIIGMGFLAFNLVYLWRTTRDTDALVIWGGIGLYAIISGVVIGLARVQHGLDLALSRWYATMSYFMWISVIVTAAAVIWRIVRDRERSTGKQLLMWINLLFCVSLVALYALDYTVSVQARLQSFIDGQARIAPMNPFENKSKPVEDCAFTSLFTRKYCGVPLEETDLLAAHRLALFAGVAPESILPGYQPGDRVVIETAAPWVNVHIRDWLLAGVERADLFHIAPDTRAPNWTDYTPPMKLLRVATNVAPRNLFSFQRFVQDAENIWYINATPRTDNGAVFEAFINSGVVERLEYKNYGLTVTHYQSIPSNLQILYDFGDTISLQAWSLVGDVSVSPCQTVKVLSWQRAEHDLETDYTLSLALDHGIVTHDTTYPAGTLRVGQYFSNQGALVIPCNIAPGEYALTLTVKDTDWNPLSATLPDGTPLGQSVYLTTLFIEEAK